VDRERGENPVSIVNTLLSLGLVDEEGKLDPDAVRDLCTAFVDAYMYDCPGCLEQDPEFWILTPEQRVIHIITYGLSLYMKRRINPLTVATLIKVDEDAVDACREAFEEAGLRW
jgi:hypothetical protein